MYGETSPGEIEHVASEIAEYAYRVHLAYGPGLLESVYEACLERELLRRVFCLERQVIVPILYDGIKIDEGFRIDLRVNGKVLVEVKAVDALHPIFAAQVKTYLKLTGLSLGLLINFNVTLIKDGIKRIVMTENLTRG